MPVIIGCCYLHGQVANAYPTLALVIADLLKAKVLCLNSLSQVTNRGLYQETCKLFDSWQQSKHPIWQSM